MLFPDLGKKLVYKVNRDFINVFTKMLNSLNFELLFQHIPYTTLFSRRRAIQLYIFLLMRIKFTLKKACAPISGQNMNRCYSAAIFWEVLPQNKQSGRLEHVFMRIEVNSNRFEILIKFHLWQICSGNNKDTRMTSFCIFIVNFEHISHFVLVFLLLTLNM